MGNRDQTRDSGHRQGVPVLSLEGNQAETD
jgi:hypothetical protein